MSLTFTRCPLADTSSATCRSGGWYFRTRYLLHACSCVYTCSYVGTYTLCMYTCMLMCVHEGPTEASGKRQPESVCKGHRAAHRTTEIFPWSAIFTAARVHGAIFTCSSQSHAQDTVGYTQSGAAVHRRTYGISNSKYPGFFWYSVPSHAHDSAFMSSTLGRLTGFTQRGATLLATSHAMTLAAQRPSLPRPAPTGYI
jgi:hypothetical protein